MEVDDRPPGRIFWTAEDVIDWIKANVPDDRAEKGSAAAAVWWCCYRDTQVLVDDTAKHVAQALLDGVGPYTEESVTDKLHAWPDAAGDEGHEAISGEIDRAIEEDLRTFFLAGR